MATRNQVLSMFGATPAQVLANQRQKQADMILSQRDPYARTGAALGTALAGLFGGKTPELERAEQLQQALGRIDFKDAESMYRGAEMLNQGGFTNEAVQLLELAQNREYRGQQIATSQAQETKAGFTTAPRFVGFKDIYGKDALGQTVSLGKQPMYENTPLPLEDYQKYINKEGAYADWYPKAGEAPGPATQSNALPEGSVTFSTGNRTPVALLPNGQYATLTDEGTIGVILDEKGLKELGGLVDPKKVETPRPADLPIIQERKQKAQEKINRARLKQPSTSAVDQTNPFSL